MRFALPGLLSIVATASVVAAAPAGAQRRDTLPVRDTLPTLGLEVRAELGVVPGHDVLRGATVTTEAGAGGFVRAAIEYRFRRGLGTYAMLGGSLARARTTAPAVDERTGTASHVDMLAGLTWRPPIRQMNPEPATLHIAGGISFISGPEDAPPYPEYSDRTPFFVWEFGVSVHPGGRFGGTIAYQTIDVEPIVSETGRSMHRLIIGLRIAR